jgi:hypothetical protein
MNVTRLVFKRYGLFVRKLGSNFQTKRKGFGGVKGDLQRYGVICLSCHEKAEGLSYRASILTPPGLPSSIAMDNVKRNLNELEFHISIF